MLQTVLRDLRFAVRVLRKSPVFTVVAVLVITLGTGAVTTIFSVANAVALRPLPGVSERRRGRRGQPGAARRHRSYWVSYPLVPARSAKARGSAARNFAAWSMMPLTIDVGDGSGRRPRGTLATGNYFGVLGVRPGARRFFTAGRGPGRAGRARPSSSLARVLDDSARRRSGVIGPTCG
jgi:hypothetical protein